MDEYAKSDDLEEKLEILSNPKSVGKYGVQCKLSIVILLQYLKEIKNNFESSSAGFLFEDFIAGLLHSRRYGGREGYDFVDSLNRTCQIKFYSETTNKIKVRHELCDYYIIGLKLKNQNGAKIWIIYNNDEVDEYLVPTVIGGKDVRMLNVSLLKENIEPYYLSFDNIDRVIKKVSDNLKDFVRVLYDNISELNYNIETIITGVDKDQNIIRVDDLETYYKKTNLNIEGIQDQILFVKDEIFSKVRRYRDKY